MSAYSQPSCSLLTACVCVCDLCVPQSHMLLARLRPAAVTSTKRVTSRSIVSMFAGKKEKAAAAAAEAEADHAPHDIVLGEPLVMLKFVWGW